MSHAFLTASAERYRKQALCAAGCPTDILKCITKDLRRPNIKQIPGGGVPPDQTPLYYYAVPPSAEFEYIL